MHIYIYTHIYIYIYTYICSNAKFKGNKEKQYYTLLRNYATQNTETPSNSSVRKSLPHIQSQLTGLHTKWQKSVKQKECSSTKVLYKCSSFSFLYKKAQIKEFRYLKKMICQKFLETISNYLNCVIMRSREQNRFVRWWTSQFSINYSSSTYKDTKTVENSHNWERTKHPPLPLIVNINYFISLSQFWKHFFVEKK